MKLISNSELGLIIWGTKRGKMVFFAHNIEAKNNETINAVIPDIRTPIAISRANIQFFSFEFYQEEFETEIAMFSAYRTLYDWVGREGFLAVSVLVPNKLQYAPTSIPEILTTLLDMYWDKYVDSSTRNYKIKEINEKFEPFALELQNHFSQNKGEPLLVAAKGRSKLASLAYKNTDDLNNFYQYFFRADISNVKQLVFLDAEQIDNTNLESDFKGVQIKGLKCYYEKIELNRFVPQPTPIDPIKKGDKTKQEESKYLLLTTLDSKDKKNNSGIKFNITVDGLLNEHTTNAYGEIEFEYLNPAAQIKIAIKSPDIKIIGERDTLTTSIDGVVSDLFGLLKKCKLVLYKEEPKEVESEVSNTLTKNIENQPDNTKSIPDEHTISTEPDNINSDNADTKKNTETEKTNNNEQVVETKQVDKPKDPTTKKTNDNKQNTTTTVNPNNGNKNTDDTNPKKWVIPAIIAGVVVVALVVTGVFFSQKKNNKTEEYIAAYQTRLNQVIDPIAAQPTFKGMKAKYDAAIDTLEAIKADNHAHEIDPVPLNALFDEKTKELLALQAKLLEKEIEEFVKGTKFSLQKAYGLSDSLLKIDSVLKTNKFQPIPETTKTNLANYTKLCEKVNDCVGLALGKIKQSDSEKIFGEKKNKEYDNYFDVKNYPFLTSEQKGYLENYHKIGRNAHFSNATKPKDVFDYIQNNVGETKTANYLNTFWNYKAITSYIKPRTK